MQASILIVSEDVMLSYSRAQLLKRWRITTVAPAAAAKAIAGKAYDLVLMCQTVRDEVAQKLALQAFAQHPNAKVMTINRQGQSRPFRSVQFVVDFANPIRLVNAVSSILRTEGASQNSAVLSGMTSGEEPSFFPHQ
jgi:hypothetical protein